jgi:hypothetical protein
VRRRPLGKRHGLVVEIAGKPLLDVRATATADDLRDVDAAFDWPAERRRGVEEGSERRDDPFDREGGE